MERELQESLLAPEAYEKEVRGHKVGLHQRPEKNWRATSKEFKGVKYFRASSNKNQGFWGFNKTTNNGVHVFRLTRELSSAPRRRLSSRPQ